MNNNPTSEKSKCEWIPCDNKGKYLKISRGRLLYLCSVHCRALKKQHDILEKSGY